MSAIRGDHIHVDSSALIHGHSAAMVVPSAAVDYRRRVRKAVGDIEAKAEADGRSKSTRVNTTAYGIPYEKRKRSDDDTQGHSVKRRIPLNNKQFSSNEWAKDECSSLRTRMLSQLAPRPQQQDVNALLRPSSYNPSTKNPSNEVIVISDDEEEDARRVWARYKEVPPSGILPTDSHQDDIIVNSVEIKQYNELAGAAHYRECLSKQGNYDRISITFDEYRTNRRAIKSLPNFDRHRDEYPAIKREATVDYSKPPLGQAAEHLTHPIFKGQTKNPLVCLAIIRVAQTNLPFINFSSALDHIHNIRPTDPFPQLPKNGFADDVVYHPRAGDSSIKTIFIPEYYKDDRHALGFYVRIWPGIASVLFTPCTTDDLDRHGLLKLAADEDHGTWQDMAVAANDGNWYARSDIAYWSPAYNWVSDYWESRLKLIMGGEEDP
jgi:hypothetical protein